VRIVLVTPEYPPVSGGGGIGTNTAALARGLTERGHAVQVIVPGGASPAATEKGTITVRRLEHRWLPDPRAERLLDDLRISRAVSRFRPDVVHATEWGATAVGPARWGRAPVVTRLATPTYLVDQLNGVPPTPGALRVSRLEQEQAHRSAAVYGPTTAIADRVGGDWRLPQVEVIPNPIDLSVVREAGASDPAMPLPRRFLAFIGRLEQRKGILELVRALPGVLDRFPDLEVVLIGRDSGGEGGGVSDELGRHLDPYRGRVHLTGELPRTRALAVLGRAELVVLPSRWESFGYVAVEAMALGRPVVATRAGGFAEIIEHDRDGWLCPPADAEALEAELVKRLEDPAGLARVAGAAVTRAEDFDIGVVTDRVVELFERVTSATAAGPAFDPSLYREGYRRYFRPGAATDPFARIYERKRRALLARVPRTPRLRVLDVGGGYGRFAEPLSEDHEVVLCDLSDEMIAEAGRRLDPSVALVQADARHLPFDDRSFDVVLAVDLLVHLPDLHAGLRELRRVLRPGGRLLFDSTNARPWWVLAYPAYVDWRPRRLLVTLLSAGVLPEWRTLVRHQRAAEVRTAVEELDLTLEATRGIGPGPLVKWHLWSVRRP
jgi:glycogen synthase